MINIDFLLTKPLVEENREKTIWIYWSQGINNAPDVVKFSLNSWLVNNEDFDLVILDDSNIEKIIGFDFFSIFDLYPKASFGIAGKSDFLRLYLLYRFGGCWVDATTFCLKPLNDWLPFNDADFFIFRQPKDCQDRKMVSWFMYSKQGGREIKTLLRKSLDFLSRERHWTCKVTSIEKLIINNETRMMISRDSTGYDYINYCETREEIPYFWMFYLWNEVCRSLPIETGKLDILTNNYVQPDASNHNFYKAFVSKQTYRDSGPVLDSIRSQRMRYIDEGKKIKPVVSIHLPKTAGTFFRTVLVNSLGSRVLLDYGDRILDYSIDALAHRNKTAINVDYTYDFYHGHFYAKKYAKKKEEFEFVTVLREPLSLLLSMYNYLNERNDTNPIIMKARELTFEEFATHPWFINLTTTILDGLNLDDFKLIGFQDDMDSYLDKFEEVYSIKLNRDVPEKGKNITVSEIVKREQLTDDFISSFMAANSKDYDFYNKAKKKFLSN